MKCHLCVLLIMGAVSLPYCTSTAIQSDALISAMSYVIDVNVATFPFTILGDYVRRH